MVEFTENEMDVWRRTPAGLQKIKPYFSSTEEEQEFKK